MWQAIGDSAPDLVAFLFSFGLLLLGFGYLAHMMWGHSAQTFTTVYNSVTSLFRFWYVVVCFFNLFFFAVRRRLYHLIISKILIYTGYSLNSYIDELFFFLSSFYIF